MQLTRSGDPTEMTGYPPCTFSVDGDYDVYMKKKPVDLKGEDFRIRQIILCFIEELHMKGEKAPKTKQGPGRYLQVPGGNSSQRYFSTTYTTFGPSGGSRMESALKYCYGKLHVENGQATHLTINEGWGEDIFDEKFKQKKYQVAVKLRRTVFEPKRCYQFFHLENLKFDYFKSEEEFKQHYLAAGKRLNVGLFPDILGPGPKKPLLERMFGPSSSEFLKVHQAAMEQIAPTGEKETINLNPEKKPKKSNWKRQVFGGSIVMLFLKDEKEG